MSLIKSNRSRLGSLPVLFDEFLNNDLFDWNAPVNSGGTTIPSVNIRESADNYQVEMAAPGMRKEDFDIKMDGNVLTISSEKQSEKQEGTEEDKYSRQEFSYESFYRSFRLPKDVVDADKIMAKYEDGILRLTIPKKEEAKQKQPRSIKVS